MDYNYLMIAVVLYIVIVIATSTCITVVPYSRDKLFSIDFPYEGFEAKENKATGTNKPKPEVALKQEVTECVKVHGFNELYCPPSHNPQYNEKFLGTAGGSTKDSYGLTNSKGGLQLTPEQIKLLTTRGGNA
jgi:hypothetical protein